MPGWVTRGLFCEVRPLPLRMKRREPSRLNCAAVGYQPVGMNPVTSLFAGSLTFTTATALLSALATSSVRPSGERPRPFGVAPGGAFGNSATEICSFAVFDATSTTHTLLVFAQATNSLAPSFDRTMAFGCSPTTTSPRFSSVAASKARIFAPPQTDTNTVLPSGDVRQVYGSAPTSTVRCTNPDLTSSIVSASPRT